MNLACRARPRWTAPCPGPILTNGNLGLRNVGRAFLAGQPHGVSVDQERRRWGRAAPCTACTSIWAQANCSTSTRKAKPMCRWCNLALRHLICEEAIEDWKLGKEDGLFLNEKPSPFPNLPTEPIPLPPEAFSFIESLPPVPGNAVTRHRDIMRREVWCRGTHGGPDKK